MGSRALTLVYDAGTPIINMFRHYDGYPGWHGLELDLSVIVRSRSRELYRGNLEGFGELCREDAETLTESLRVELGNQNA